MYNKESVRRVAKAKGVQYVLDRIFSGELSENAIESLENEGVLRNHVPCISFIMAFANS